MKLLHLTFHFEFTERIEAILDAREVRNYVRIPMVPGKDRTGKHQGTQVHPGNVTIIQAQVPEDVLDGLMDDLSAFRRERQTHRHLEAIAWPVERRLEDDGDDG